MPRAVETTGHRSALLRAFSADGGRAGLTSPNPCLRGRRFVARHCLVNTLVATFYLLYLLNFGTFRAATSEPTDPVASARCLLTGQCGGSSRASSSGSGFQRDPGFEPEPEWWSILLPTEPLTNPLERQPVWPEAKSHSAPSGARCAASAGLKKMPSALRGRIVAAAGTSAANICAKAVAVLTPLRDQIYAAAFDTSGHDARMARFEHAAASYVRACFNDDILQNAGAPSAADEQFMKSHAGHLVMRSKLAWTSAKPICHAGRLGNKIITAQHCVPLNSEAYKAGRGATPELGFRFFGQQKVYPLVLRKLGNGPARAINNRSKDYAVFEIQNAPELAEDAGKLAGKLDLFADFYMMSANVYLRIAQKVNEDQPDTAFSTRTEHSTLCRPSYVTPTGLFLHACHTEAGVSGAPFFQHRDGRLVFVGMHNGVTEALENPALASCAAGLPNYGIAIAPAVLSELR